MQFDESGLWRRSRAVRQTPFNECSSTNDRLTNLAFGTEVVRRSTNAVRRMSFDECRSTNVVRRMQFDECRSTNVIRRVWSFVAESSVDSTEDGVEFVVHAIRYSTIRHDKLLSGRRAGGDGVPPELESTGSQNIRNRKLSLKTLSQSTPLLSSWIFTSGNYQRLSVLRQGRTIGRSPLIHASSPHTPLLPGSTCPSSSWIRTSSSSWIRASSSSSRLTHHANIQGIPPLLFSGSALLHVVVFSFSFSLASVLDGGSYKNLDDFLTGLICEELQISIQKWNRRRGAVALEYHKKKPLGPKLEFSAEEAIQCQLDALKYNDQPRQDYGIEVMYRFAGFDPFERSTYFGPFFDLGQFERFRRIFHHSTFRVLLCHKERKILSSLWVKEGQFKQRVWVQGSRPEEEEFFQFTMVQRVGGRWDGYWLTESLHHDGDAFLGGVAY
ncbi:hypothetical protein KSP39_PZI024486 [Platanthera zijinensis]|uniref:Uncharacterized protein n=1 Tax=Platanthera zijinensis TaxID=2320716 RepID=A0AAP0AT67_9ASPA